MQDKLKQDVVYSEELEALLEAREKGEVEFLLIDCREDMEYRMGYIKGVDALYPTSEFSSWAETFAKNNHEKTIIFTCRTGNRSGQLQRIFKNHGIDNVINHGGGIVSYRGEITR